MGSGGSLGSGGSGVGGLGRIEEELEVEVWWSRVE